MNKLVVLIFLFSNFIFANIISSLSNRSLDISGFFFTSSKAVYFSVVNDDSNFSVWKYNGDRSYKPIHNTISFDDYPKASSIFDSIKIDKDYRHLNITSSKNSDYDYLSNEELKIIHILVKSSKHNILVNSDLSSMWEYFNGDEGRKYKPIHNTIPFDGYGAVKEMFTKLELQNNSIKIYGTNRDNYLELKRMEYDAGKIKAIKILNSKDYEDNYEKLSNNIIRDKANNLVWFNDKDILTKTYKEAEEYCENLKIGEYNNFRIPNMFELISLFDVNGKHKDVFTLGITNKSKDSFLPPPPMGRIDTYWSNNIDSYNRRDNNMGLKFYLVDDKAYFIGSNTPYSFFISQKKPTGYIKCVESDKTLSSPMLVRNSDKEIVEDVTNNLMWQDDKYVRKDINISKADDYCKSVTLGGYDDWRLPTYKESLVTYYNNHTKDRVNDFYNWTRYYTLMNDALSPKTQTYIIDNSYKLSRNKSWEYGALRLNLGNMPRGIRDDILDVLNFKEDKSFSTFIKSTKEGLSKIESKIEITSGNHKSIIKKYEDELLSLNNKYAENQAIPTGLTPSNPAINYSFVRTFFIDYYIGEELKEELKDLVYIDRINSKKNHLRNINHYKKIITFYESELNIENFFISRKLMNYNSDRFRSLNTSSYSDFYFNGYLDIFSAKHPFSGIINNVRKICVRDNLK